MDTTQAMYLVGSVLKMLILGLSYGQINKIIHSEPGQYPLCPSTFSCVHSSGQTLRAADNEESWKTLKHIGPF